MIPLSSISKIYFLGIGGIGMSSLARYFSRSGIEVSGYDKTETILTKELEAEGIRVHFDDNVSSATLDADLIIYTPAVKKDLSIFTYFLENDFKIYKRAEVLGMISQGKNCIAIAGTHGKTTTSTMTAYLLSFANLDISAFLGGVSTNFESNYLAGSSDIVVVEADEYDRSFLHLFPSIAVVLSMDPDHLDIYGNSFEMNSSYITFASQVKNDGLIFYKHGLDLELKNESVHSYSFGIECGEIQGKNITVSNGFFHFDFTSPWGDISGLSLSMPGLHNTENAVVACAIAKFLGVDDITIKNGLKSFKGIRRRFEIHNLDKKVYIDDYAHHPTELKAAISAGRMMFPGKKITGIFQPHLYSRTRDFVDGFAEALDELDDIVLLDIYPARELPIEGITSKVIFEKMKSNSKMLASKDQVLEIVADKNIEVLMTLGAGDIDTLIQPLKEIMSK
jgi:UDP-N-acetylmuramate--alanine ligase